MRRVALLLMMLLVLAGLALLGLAIAHHKGYVLIAYDGFRYESSLWATLALLAVVALLVYLVRLLLSAVVVTGGLVNPWSGRHRRRRIHQASEQGFLDLAEGRWERALRHLKRAAEADPRPLAYYLGAARAAQALGDAAESDRLLARALERQPDAELAIALTHAELQVERGETDGARDTLEAMRARHPRHPQVLRQLQRVYLMRGDWAPLRDLVPVLRKEKALGDSELDGVERQVWTEYLGETGTGETHLAELQAAWQAVPSARRQEPALLAAYAERLHRLGADDEAEKLVRQALRDRYDARLVRLYGLLQGSEPGKQLQTAEAWLAQHPSDPVLLLTLGRLCLHNQLWGKANEYFESSLAFERDPETCAELAHLLAERGDVERSNRLFREGFDLLERSRHPVTLPVPQAG